ncbi:hypothetical protein OUZ56_033487 [Daphnia magna]|uniref:Uncharacterized protein n=1 Tax=Daphnia magna TaxID=35525 RepID=A0ABQ9ZXY7_9CRUS|nr:hypothetical protein OUZ56_033487 [Daphnia magna]
MKPRISSKWRDAVDASLCRECSQSEVNGSSSSSTLDKGLSGIFIPTSEKVMLYNGNILSQKLCSTP